MTQMKEEEMELHSSIGDPATPLDAMLAILRERLVAVGTSYDLSPILHAVRDFAEWRGPRPPATSPDDGEVRAYLGDRRAALGQAYAAANLANLQLAAPTIWTVEAAARIGLVLRQDRVSPKTPARTADKTARAAIARLPEAMRSGFEARLPGGRSPTHQHWSSAHATAVANALARWLRWCDAFGHTAIPSGVLFNAYVEDVRQDGVSLRSAADYISRIQAGHLAAVDPTFRSLGVDHVISQTNAKAKRTGRITKTGSQIVGASTIYDLGFELIAAARARGPRGLHVARDFRNGLLLAVASALPQRARALSHLRSGTTLTLLDAPLIHIALPGSVLKLREHMKANSGYDRVFGNAQLWSALDDYLRHYRPLFDDGTALFPSILDMGAAISSVQLGRLAGDLTEKHLDVRIPIHRIRDNVATEASEELSAGGYLAPALLNHADAATTMASYDHAEGVRAARDYDNFLDSQRSVLASLSL